MRHTSGTNPAVILLVEDDPGDQELTRRALDAGGMPYELHVVQDGEEALDYLFRRGKYRDPRLSPRPDLILLDLNMPRVDGRQVLRHIRADPGLRRLAVVVLTTSRLEEDVTSTYDLGANSYITKPAELQRFLQMMQTLGTYWFQVAVLPPSRG